MKRKKVLAVVYFGLLALLMVASYSTFFHLDAGLLHRIPQTKFFVPMYLAVLVLMLCNLFKEQYLVGMKGVNWISQCTSLLKTLSYIMVIQWAISFVSSDPSWWIASSFCSCIIYFFEVVVPMVTRPGID